MLVVIIIYIIINKIIITVLLFYLLLNYIFIIFRNYAYYCNFTTNRRIMTPDLNNIKVWIRD